MLEHNVGTNVRRLRRERDWTQGQLARFVGVHQQHLSDIERGLRPSTALLDRLARALGVTPHTLFQANTPTGQQVVARCEENAA